MSRLRLLARLRRDRRGVALIEFAFILPILVLFFLTGAELVHYITTKMRVGQLALKLADDAARMGSGSLLAAKTINEADINDLFTGSNLQAGELGLKANGRIVLSSLEPMANPNTTDRYKIRWQRCYGNKAYTPTYGTAGQTNVTGMGPAGRQTKTTDDNATMFVEVYYVYTPLVSVSRAPSTTMMEFASMAVRDRRDLTGGSNGVYPVTGVTASTC